MSIVNKVLELLNIEVSDERRAAIIDANIKPFKPTGNMRTMSNAYEIFEQPSSKYI
jgi:hypothetical protein